MMPNIFFAFEFLERGCALEIEAFGGIHGKECMGGDAADHLVEGGLVFIRFAFETHYAVDDIGASELGGIFCPLP